MNYKVKKKLLGSILFMITWFYSLCLAMKINTQLYPFLYIRLHYCIYFSFVLARFRCQFQSPSREKKKKKKRRKLHL